MNDQQTYERALAEARSAFVEAAGMLAAVANDQRNMDAGNAEPNDMIAIAITDPDTFDVMIRLAA